MAFIAPAYTRGEVDRAGNAFRKGEGDAQSLEVLENWRASHLYVINTFQANLRNRRKSFNGNVVIAQRLKRRPTILDKLQREPGMMLSRMHDIAGCRLIFDDVEQLRAYRAGVRTSKARHENTSDDDRYDYIAGPKSSGYRGVHDVYKYVAYARGAEKWNNLRIELQYRTRVQHAWATAVEIVDMVNAKRLKFGQAEDGLTRQFLLASEILARHHEGMPGYCATADLGDIKAEFSIIETDTHAIARLRELTGSNFQEFARSAKLFVLVNFFDAPLGRPPFEAYGFSDNRAAVDAYEKLEQDYQGLADVVLVGAREQDAVRLAYTNYLSDASTFLALLDAAMP